MQMATRWIRSLSKKAPEASIQYHADQDLDELREFWAELSGSSRVGSGCSASRTAAS
jgi:hypothetical protein